MKNTLLLIAAVAALQTFNPVSAQSKKNIKDSSTVIIFNSNSTSSSHSKGKGSSESTVIKIAPLGLLSGTFPILVERRITDFFSLQGAIGVTHKNYMRSAFVKESELQPEYPWTDNSSYDISEELGAFSYRKPKLGFMASIQPRGYFASEGLDGSFVGLSFDYYRYNFEIPGIVGTENNNRQAGDLKSEFENIKDFMVHFGYQSMGTRLSYETSTAIGLRNVAGSKYVAAYNNGKLMEGAAPYKQTLLNFNIGIKVGYHF
jgi:hypothetical protein